MDFVHPVAAVIPGAQGRVLAVLTETTAELNLRTLARLAGVSVAQASRVLPGLVELGLVERREVPPSSQFRLVRTNVAAQAILAIAGAQETVFTEISRLVEGLTVRPASVILFGSFARGEADRASDLDVVIVRPSAVGEDSDAWADSIDQWRTSVHALTGNRVDILEVGSQEAASRLAADHPLWQDIRREGRVVFGLSLDDLTGVPVG
jgi:predicted nucleotidyltransferase